MFYVQVVGFEDNLKKFVKRETRERKSDLTTHFGLGGVSPSGPDRKFALVSLHVFSDAHVTGLEEKRLL